MHREASYYIIEENKKVRCVLCPKECLVSDGKTGTCGVRQNLDGKMYALTYSKPVSIHLDPIEKKPLYHFHPGSKILSIGTYGCNLNCKFCQNYDISQEFDLSDIDRIESVTPEQIIELCKNRGYRFIAFTYNEPSVFYEYMFDVARLCKKNGIMTVMVSNGQLNREPLLELIKYMDAFNIDLKSFNPDFYKKICGGSLEITKSTIKTIVENKRHLEVTFLLIEGLNDSEKEFSLLCRFLSEIDSDIVLHISRAFPRFKMDFEVTPLNLMRNFVGIAGKYLNNVYAGNV